ncbi:FRG1-like family protein [Mytilinidion resinicola]|uniref:FRG1-like family protein n=1 Tax=Mytilinidion resinicola TaxID=574789 RepID=A0A6A6YJX2_9PEZI|nr:FRG1-like family protein [Mytilinidion resinicola]KAF2808264.1 FRG1-like family protein [Mytilinidion resinicola]
MPVKPLTFKGDKKTKKRKRTAAADDDTPSKSTDLTTTAAAKEADPEDDSWVSAEAASDVSGPIIFVLPTEPATCLACDANGKVWTSAVENFVDGDPSTAEPHDVRQVWIANRVAGTERFSFKGHHGRYLSCDKYGLLTATPPAVSPIESFLLIPLPSQPAVFAIQADTEKFLAVDDTSASPTVRGDAEELLFNTGLRVRMQARFKPRLKVAKAEKAAAKISRKELEEAVGRRLEDDEVKKLKKARKEGDYHEVLLDVKVKGKHDKFA